MTHVVHVPGLIAVAALGIVAMIATGVPFLIRYRRRRQPADLVRVVAAGFASALFALAVVVYLSRH